MAMPFDDEEKKKEVVRNYLLDKWKAANSKGDEDMKSAKEREGYLDIGNIAGGVLTNLSNANRSDTFLYNGIDNLSAAPKRVEAYQSSWDPSTLKSIGAKGVGDARERRKDSIDDIETENRFAGLDRSNRINERDDTFKGEQQDFDRKDMAHTLARRPIKDAAEDSKIAFDDWDRERTKSRAPGDDAFTDSQREQAKKDWGYKNQNSAFEASQLDPNSPVSKKIGLLYSNAILQKAREAERANDPAAAKALRAMAKNPGMSAREQYDSLKMMNQMDWGDVIASQDRDKLYALRDKLAKEKGANGEDMPIDTKKTVIELAGKNASKMTIANQIDNDLKVLMAEKDPKQKFYFANNMLKTLNSLEGPDALTGDDSARLAGMLKFAYGNFGNDSPIQFGRDLEGFEKFVQQKSFGLRNSIKSNKAQIDELMGRQAAPSAAGAPGRSQRRRVESIDDL